MEKRNDNSEITQDETKKLMKYKVVSSVEKVLPTKEPEACDTEFAGLKGETVSFQIAYYWNGINKVYGEVPEPEIEICISENMGKPFSKENITIRKVMLVPCQYANHSETDEDYLCTEPGLYPDLLRNIDKTGFSVISNQWRSIWIDLEIPRTVDAGRYEISFELKSNSLVNSDEKFSEKVKVSLEIIDAQIPELDIPHTEWFHCDCLAEYYDVPVFSNQHWEIIENYIRLAVKRGCNVLYTPLFTPPLDTAVGAERLTVQLVDVYVDKNNYSFDFKRFERWIQLGQTCGIKYFEMSHLFTQWGAKSTPKIIGIMNGETKTIFGWNTEACSEEYANFLKIFLKALDNEIHKLGIQDNIFFHISDEPSSDQIGSYQAARNLVKECLPNYHLIDAISNYEFYEKDIVDEPVCASDHIKDFLSDNKRPNKLWVYYCTAQYLNVSNRFISMPGTRTRIIGDMIYRHRIDGFLHWGFNYYNSQYSLYCIDPYQTPDADGAFPAGDPFLVYPGENGYPEESIRIMLMDEAFTDYRALKLLESLTSFENAIDCLDEKQYGLLSFDSYPHDKNYVLNVRKAVNQKIKQVIKGADL